MTNRFHTAFPQLLSAVVLSLSVGLAACQSRASGQASAQPSVQASGQAAQGSASTLKIVNGPSGGQFAYGSLTGNGTLKDAMIYMLRNIHQYFGDKPQVGKFFQSRDGDSLATFFTLKVKTGKQMAGLVLVTLHGNSNPQVSVLYDYADHFSSSEPDLMKALSAAQQGSSQSNEAGSQQQVAASQGPDSASQRGGPEPLTMATGGDRSATIGLPAGWKLTGVSGGKLTVEGPHHELMGLGLLYQGIIDPRNPQSRMITGMPNFGSQPHLIYPLTDDLFSAFASITNQNRRNINQPQGTFSLISSTPQPQEGGAVRPMQFIFNVDFHDGAGPRKGSARVGVIAMRGSPTWAMTVSTSNVPVQYAEAESPTMLAMIRSYSQDARVIGQEGAAALNRIQQQGLANQAQTDAINARREASNQSYEAQRQQFNQNRSDFEQHNADIDWQSKINQDYILDRSVIRDTDDTVHATLGNNLADNLVRNNPNKLEYVPNQQLVQGVDY